MNQEAPDTGLQKTGPQVPEKKEGPKRFVEKGPHVIFDTKTQIYWLKKDSWQDKAKFVNWHEAREYADKKNMRKIGGFEDWRLPTMDEALTLFDPSQVNIGKGGVEIHIDTIFPVESFKCQWLMGDTSTRRPRFDYIEGKMQAADEYSFGSVRLCRKDAIRRNDHPRNRR
ncbi:MAG: hypothetical protein COV67_05380 [Nitrospinae bacterium CG11_big_fil_rev_8_21_14_0_20_56_8]|nr:MAG: hypothetical protein COV67_05380 [Nitrospinae bacterium CG11_big_fil_rev_8_21_14_0_20_56_8]